MNRLLLTMFVVILIVVGVERSIHSAPPSYYQFGSTYIVDWTDKGERKVYFAHSGNEALMVEEPWYMVIRGDSKYVWTCIGKCDIDPANNFTVSNMPSNRMTVGTGVTSFSLNELEIWRNKGRRLARERWPEAFKKK